MRYRELLLEYSREKTVDKMGEKLIQRVERDFSARHVFDESMKKANSGSSGDDRVIALHILSILESFDPTPNKMYVQWLVSRYIGGGIRLWEDLSRAHSALSEYHSLKTSGYFKRNIEANQQFGDIGRIKTLSDLQDFLAPLSKDETTSNAQKDRDTEQQFFESGQAELLADNPVYRIVVPHTKEASCWFGRNTQWCTAATKSTNYFKDYSDRGDLYIVLKKATNQRWQLHFEDEAYMDERDDPIVDWNASGFPMEAFKDMRLTQKSDIDKTIILCGNQDSDGAGTPDVVLDLLLDSIDVFWIGVLIIISSRHGLTQRWISKLILKVKDKVKLPDERKINGGTRIDFRRNTASFIAALAEAGLLESAMSKVHLIHQTNSHISYFSNQSGDDLYKISDLLMFVEDLYLYDFPDGKVMVVFDNLDGEERFTFATKERVRVIRRDDLKERAEAGYPSSLPEIQAAIADIASLYSDD